VTPRVSPAERIRAEMAELIADTTTGSLADKFEEVARLAVRLALQSRWRPRSPSSSAGTATQGVSGSVTVPVTATARYRSSRPPGR
jgi:hypothetical protein